MQLRTLFEGKDLAIAYLYLPNNPVAKELADYSNKLKSQADAKGQPLLNGKHIQGKLMAKTANLMLKEFVERFVAK